MLKQSSSRIRKVLAILLTVLFVASLISVTASAYRGHGFGHGGHWRHGGHWGHGGWGYGGYGGYYGGWGYGGGCYYMGGVLVCPSYGYGGYLI
jgi:uncharacterized membrane protein